MITSPPTPNAVRLFSPKTLTGTTHHQNSTTSKILHLIRHAEGTHNLCPIESKLPIHYDAKLTPRGVEQCHKLSLSTKQLAVESVLVSPLTRCLETATLGFRHLVDEDIQSVNSDEDGSQSDSSQNVPFIAYEEWRETANYLCDSRRPIDILEHEYPHVDFQFITHNHDPIWNQYEQIFGSHDTHNTLRESNDPPGLYSRAHSAWKILLSRPERELALVGHSAFFMHMFTPLWEELKGVVSYEDEAVGELMSGRGFDNCELRTVVVDYP